MASNTETTVTKAKAATPKRPARKPTATKAASATPRRTARTKTPSVAKALQNVPQWLTVGASITGAAVAIGATLFATRNEWLPRARKFGDWVENSVHDQLDHLDTVKSNAIEAVKARAGKNTEASIPVAAASFEPSGADAGVVVN
jgi:cell wall-associated NlpC family hydrolase